MKRILLTLLLILFTASAAFPVTVETINQQPEITTTPAVADEVPVWDASNGDTRKVTYANFVNAPNVNAYGGLATAVSTIGATVKAVVVNDTQTLTADLTVPSTLTIVVIPPGKIVTSTFTLTLNGGFECPPHHQAFDVSGGGTVTGLKYATCEMWGPNTTQGTTDMSAECQAAIDAIEANTGGIVHLSAEQYNLGTTGLSIEKSVIFEGSGYGDLDDIGTTLLYTGTGAAIQLTNGNSDAWNSIVRELRIDGSDTGAYGIQTGDSGGGSPLSWHGTISNVYITGCATAGLRVYGSQGGEFRKVHSEDNPGDGIIIESAAAALDNTASAFYSCRTNDNDGNGLVINAAVGFSFYDCIFEDEGGYGVDIDNSGGASITKIQFIGGWTEACQEANNGVEKYSFHIHVGSGGANVTIQGFNFGSPHDTTNHGHIWLEQGTMWLINNKYDTATSPRVRQDSGTFTFLIDNVIDLTNSTYFSPDADASMTYIGRNFLSLDAAPTSAVNTIKRGTLVIPRGAASLTGGQSVGWLAISDGAPPGHTSIGTVAGAVAKTQAVSPYTVPVAENGYRYSNNAASGTVELDLPAGYAGARYSAVRVASQALRLDPNGVEVIIGCTAGEYLELDTDGDAVTLEWIAGQWMVVAGYGTYACEP